MAKSFVSICRMSEKKLKEYVANRLLETHEEITIDDGFVFAQGKFPVLLVAHMDTVHDKLPTVIFTAKDKDGNTTISSPMGIGGDDRCGVYMIFEVLKKFNCSVLFCEQEEVGGIGARKFTQHPVSKDLKFNYAIEFDRKGNNDAVFYDCDNPEFEEFITKEFFKTAYGTFSDISTVAPHLGCAAVNLSCGYYNAHTTKEYVVKEEMFEIVNQTCKILERTTETDVFEYIEAINYWKGSFGGGCYRGYSGWYDELEMDSWGSKKKAEKEIYFLINYYDIHGTEQWEEVYATSYEAAVGKFLIEHELTCFGKIIDIIADEDYYY